jgi:DNA polymerase III delta prime subunit
VAPKISLDQSGPFVLDNSTPKQNGRESVGSNMAQREDWSSVGSEDKLLEIELNLWRRKRRKSASPKPEDVESQSVCQKEVLANDELREGRRRTIKGTRKNKGDFENCGADSRSATANFKQTSVEAIEPIKVLPINSHIDTPRLGSYQSGERESSDQKSQKILRLNPTTGTIGSPPPKKISSIMGTGRSRASLNKAASLIIKMKYGTDESVRLSVGQKISNLLSGIKVAEGLREKAGKKDAPYPPQPVPKGPEPLKQAVPSRPTHPFFLGKLLSTSESTDPVVEQVILAKELPTHKNFPVEKVRSISPEKPQPPVGSPFRLHMDSNGTKITRGMEPCWPPKDMFHLRGREPNCRQREPSFVHAASRKSKYLATEPSAKNSVLKTVGKKLDIGQVLHDLEQIDTSAFTEPARCLRIPKKQFATGLEIQKKIRRELHTCFPSACDSSEDEFQGEGLHPAMRKVYELIASTLSAFDRSECESQSWIHKYAPSSASEVLQIGKEAFILKDWLQTLTVMAVDDGSRSRTASLSSKRSSSKSSRRKRKAKLETFIVSSDEEDYELDEISEPEDESLHSQKSRKTVIRTNNNKEAGKQMNAVVISGPCGCGKTAMVYAVAKELGFEVFEINSSSRRNGKDILEKVGDMTRNHLVRRLESQGGSEASESSGAELKSGRQKTVNSFFKSRLKSKKQQVMDSEDRHQKPQTQSLILLEEVDILFEEDKQFWTTVMTLIVQSKRPIIMTCNDEALVPLQALPLHAIIRLSPPPLDLAVDYMLLVAAAEGHIIQRQAVEALFNARRWDLRASITELDYWCQFGVGDRKGGLDWFYPRWPPGSDIDAEGNTVRVVSEDTYVTGMGWLGRDSQYNGDDQSFQEELLHETGHSWHIDLDLTETLEGSFLELSSYKSFVDSMSLADLCTYGSLSTDYRVRIRICKRI